MIYDLLLYNGNFFRFNNEKNYSWLLINNGVIVGAGHNSEYEKYLSQSREQVDLNESTVLPGLYDSHVHFIQSALHMNNVDLNGAKNYDEIEKRILNWISKHLDKQLIIGYGLEISDLEEKRLPTRKILDKFSKDYAIILNGRDFHKCVLNTKAINMLKVPFNLEGIERDEEGNPTGIIYGKANALIRKKVLKQYQKKEEKIDAIKNLMHQIIKKGVTSIHAVEGGFHFADSDAELLLNYIDEIPIDIALYYNTTDISKIHDTGLNRIGGDIFLDGSFASMNAAISFNYKNENHGGILYYSQKDINEYVCECYKNNLDTAIHAVGDRAVEQILKAHEYAHSIYPNNKLRHRIEHAEITNQDQRRIAKELGIIFSMQPAFEYFYGGEDSMYKNTLGEHYTVTNEFRNIIDEGIIICGGSDSDLTPIDPVLGIYAAVNHPNRQSSVTVEEAVKMFTINAAYAVREENEKGSIQIGKMADLAILDIDIFKVNPKAIITAEVIGTLKEGKFLYKNF